MEEWSKQADETKFEGGHHILHKDSISASQFKRIEDSRNIPQLLKTLLQRVSFFNSISMRHFAS